MTTPMTTLITIDLVCGMQVEPSTATVVEHAGRPYYFCESACADMFRDDPERWTPSESRVLHRRDGRPQPVSR